MIIWENFANNIYERRGVSNLRQLDFFHHIVQDSNKENIKAPQDLPLYISGVFTGDLLIPLTQGQGLGMILHK